MGDLPEAGTRVDLQHPHLRDGLVPAFRQAMDRQSFPSTEAWFFDCGAAVVETLETMTEASQNDWDGIISDGIFIS